MTPNPIKGFVLGVIWTGYLEAVYAGVWNHFSDPSWIALAPAFMLLILLSCIVDGLL